MKTIFYYLKNTDIVLSVFILLFLSNTYFANAQEAPFEENYISTYDEYDLYINNNRISRQHFEQETPIASGYLGIGNIFSNSGSTHSKQINDIPPPPPPPDVPVNKNIFLLMISGLGIVIIKFYKKLLQNIEMKLSKQKNIFIELIEIINPHDKCQ